MEHLDAAEVPNISADLRWGTMEVDGKPYSKSVFVIQAQGAYAKAVIFSAEAIVAVRTKHYIWAAISGYYSFFHLATSIMFILPELIHHKLVSRLIKERAGGAEDPTRLIPHYEKKPKNDVCDFLNKCESKGLTSEFQKLLERAKKIREFVNYAPRAVWRDKMPSIMTREYRTEDVEGMVTSIGPLLGTALTWASRQGDLAKVIALAAIESLDQFLNQADLLYVEWCAPQVLVEAREVRARLRQRTGLVRES